MLPSPAVHFSVAVSPFPILSVTRNAASISEDGGTATFTISASSAPASDIIVTLLTGGSYGSGEVTGIPVSGTTFTVTLAQSTTSVTIPITANHDTNGVNETVTLGIQPDPANPPAYTVGTPASASVTIQDDNAPVLTLSADRSTMTNLQVATFTVNATFAPQADLVVNVASSGYATGTVIVPSGLTIPSGATSAQFQVSASTGAGYEVQNPQVSLATGSGYSIGSPGAQSLQISDATLGVFNYDGVWGFNSGSGSAVGGGASWNLGGNVSVTGGSLAIGGNYSTDTATVALSNGSVVFNQNLFTIGVKFAASDLSASRPLFVGGYGWRWIMVNIDTSGNLSVDLKNHANTLPLTGMTISAGTTYTLVLNVSVDPVLGGISITAWLNGSPVSTGIAPGSFTWDPAQPPDAILTASDYSNGRMFKGTWDWAFAANGLLDYTTVVNLTAAVAP